MRSIIEEIKLAEQNAENFKVQAQKEVEAIIAKTKSNGKEHIENTIIKANNKAEELIKQAEKEAAVYIKYQINEAEKEADKIMKKAQTRMDKAVVKIAEGIVSNL